MKVSFFKLPLVYTLLYVLFYVIITYLNQIVMTRTILIFYFIKLVLVYNIPQYLWIIFLSSIAFNRSNTYQVSGKNIMIVVGVAFAASLIVFLFKRFFGYHMFGWVQMIFDDDDYSNSSYVMTSFRIATDIITYLISGLMTYFGIISLQNMFIKKNDFALFEGKSNKIHLWLFITFYAFICSAITLQLLILWSFSSSFSVDYNTAIFNIIYYTFIITTTIIIYFLVRNLFTRQPKVLETGSIVKSVFLSLLCSFLVNAVIGFIFMWIISYVRYDSHSVAYLLLIGAILQLITSCMVIRAVIRRYFGQQLIITK